MFIMTVKTIYRVYKVSQCLETQLELIIWRSVPFGYRHRDQET
jgi:hypothetical protein